jgi:hypothetical protein
VALFDGGLYVASGPGAEVLIDGEPLPEVWQRVDHTHSIAIGEAQLELVWERASESAGASSERDRPTFPDMVRPAVLVSDPSAEPSGPARTSWVGRVSRTSWLDSPTLLGRVAESRSSSQVLRYALLILFTALAYRAWLLLLDRI